MAFATKQIIGLRTSSTRAYVAMHPNIMLMARLSLLIKRPVCAGDEALKVRAFRWAGTICEQRTLIRKFLHQASQLSSVAGPWPPDSFVGLLETAATGTVMGILRCSSHLPC